MGTSPAGTARSRPLLSAAAFAAVTLVLLAGFNHGLSRIYHSHELWRAVTPFALTLAGALAFVQVRYRDFSDMLRACTKATGLGLLVFLIVERPDVTVAIPGAEAAGAYIEYGYFPALACAAIGLFRPALLAPAAVYVISTRLLTLRISGVPISILDIRYMVDMAFYLVGFGLLVTKLGPRLHPWLGLEARQNEIVGVAMGLHLANYFWSGVAKLLIGPTPWYWALENRTYNQISYALENGVLPMATWPWLTDLSYQFIKLAVVPLNVAILLAQLFAIVCVFHRSWLKIASLAYEALHVGIYAFGGLFFWPWIWNNVTVWFTARKAAPLAAGTKVACVTAILLGAPFLHLNTAAWLAWFDLSDARQVFFEAVTKDGREVKAPSAFFLTQSYSMAHGYLAGYAAAGQYPATRFGSSSDVKRNELSGRCSPPSTFDLGRLEAPAVAKVRQATVARYLRVHHSKMMARESRFGWWNYYARFHHIPSNPFLYAEFNRLNLRDVVGYNMVLESVCHGLDHGRNKARVIARSTEFYRVR